MELCPLLLLGGPGAPCHGSTASTGILGRGQQGGDPQGRSGQPASAPTSLRVLLGSSQL